MRWSIWLLPLATVVALGCGGDDGWDESTGWGQPSTGETVGTTPTQSSQSSTTNPYSSTTTNPYATNPYATTTDPTATTDPVNTDPVIPASTSNADTLRLVEVGGSWTTNALCAFWDLRFAVLAVFPVTGLFKMLQLGKLTKVIKVVKLVKWGTVGVIGLGELTDCNLKVEVTFVDGEQPITKMSNASKMTSIASTTFTPAIAFHPKDGVVGKRVTARLFDIDSYLLGDMDVEIGTCVSNPITGNDVDAGQLNVACEFSAVSWLQGASDAEAATSGESGFSLTPVSGILTFAFK